MLLHTKNKKTSASTEALLTLNNSQDWTLSVSNHGKQLYSKTPVCSTGFLYWFTGFGFAGLVM